MKLIQYSLVIFLFLISNSTALAQTDFQSIIESEVVKDKIKFKIINKNLEMAIDNGIYKPVPKEINLQGKSNIIVFNSDYIHPLKYKISLENKLVEDELKNAVQEFLSKLVTSIQSINKSTTPTLKGFRTLTRKDEHITLKNKHLIELFSLLNGMQNNFFDKETSKEFLNAMKNVSNENFDAIITSYNEMFTNIWDIKKYEEIDIVFKENKKLAEIIDTKLKTTKTINKTLQEEATKFIGSFLKDDKTSLTINTTELIKLKIKDVEVDFNSFIKTKESLDEKYEKIKDLFTKINDRTYKEKTKETRIDTVSFKKGKKNEVTIYLKIYDYNKESKSLTEKEQKEYKINLRKYQRLIPVISSGVLYSNLTFNSFGTGTNANDETIIEKGRVTENEITIGAYLNLYLNNGWQNPVFLQLGIGPSKEKPLLFGGVGMNIASRVSLSVGTVFTWAPSLNQLKVGDVVSGTVDIENDIIYNFTNTPKFYLGISYNLSK